MRKVFFLRILSSLLFRDPFCCSVYLPDSMLTHPFWGIFVTHQDVEMKHFYFNGFPKPTSPNTLLMLTGHNEHKQTNLKSKMKTEKEMEN